MIGDIRQLLVKNITKDDLTEYTCEARGDKCSAKLSQMSPWIEKVSQTDGPLGGIAVFELMVQPHTHVNWFIGNQKITKQKFRFARKHGIITYRGIPSLSRISFTKAQKMKLVNAKV